MNPTRPNTKLATFFLLSFCIGLPRLFTLAVSDSLFLLHYPADWVPWAYLGRAAVIPLLGLVLFSAEKRLANSRVLVVILGALIGLLAGFLALFKLSGWNWPYLALLVWVSAEWTLSGIVFWNSANRHFNLREGKKYFGLLTAGEVIASGGGGLLIPVLLRFMAPADLLWLSIIGLAAALLILLRLERSAAPAAAAPRVRPRPGQRPLDLAGVFRNPYLLGLFGLVSFDYLTHYFADNAFFIEVQAGIKDPVALTGYIGVFLGLLGAATLAFKLLLTDRLLARLGLGAALAIGPAILALMAVAVSLADWFPGAGGLGVGLLGLVTATKFAQMLFGEALFSPAYYLLFQPLPPAERTRVQNLADTVPGRITGGLGGLALLGLGWAGAASTGLLCAILAVLGILWLALALRTRRSYRAILQRSLEQGAAADDGPHGAADGAATAPPDAAVAADRLEETAVLRAAWDRDGGATAPWMDGILVDEERQAAEELIEALGRRHPGDSLAGIRGCLDSGTPDLRAYAIEYLETLLDPPLRGRVIACLEGCGPVVPGAFASLALASGLAGRRPLFDRLSGQAAAGGEPEGDLERLLFLKSMELFSHVPYWYLARLAGHTRERHFAAGDTIMTKGDAGSTLHLVRSGEVRVHDGDKTFARMGPGSLFGEYAVLCPSPRSASVTALAEVRTMELGADDLLPVLREHRPALEGVLRLLCGRLRQKPYRGLCEEPLLAGRGSADRAALEAAGIVAELAPGETLFEAGELTTVLHLVLEGEVEWGSETRGGGAAMDETAFLSDQPAADSCRTRGPVKLLMLEKPALLAVMAGSPETLEGCFAVLVERLKRSNAL